MPQLTIYECPQCQKRSEEMLPGSLVLPGWINVTANSMTGVPPNPEWLCSWACVVGYATAHDAKRA